MQPTSKPPLRRRALLAATVGGLCSSLGVPARAAGASAPLAAMTEGPFYPPSRWRERWPDWDADLTVVQRNGVALKAQGELLDLQTQVVDTHGRPLDGAQVEIWQCDALTVYRHPSVHETGDPGFAGFGAATTDTQGRVRFRTIRPVPYPGRTPHIHVRVRHASFGELTSQLFVAGDAGNARDFLWRSLSAPQQAGLAMALQTAAPDGGLRWAVRHALVVPG